MGTLWLFVALLAAAGTAHASEPALSEDAPAHPPLDPRSIGLKAAELEQTLRDLDLHAGPPADARAILAGLPDQTRAIQEHGRRTLDRMDAPGATVELRDARAAWSRRASRLRAQRGALLDYGATLDRQTALVTSEHERWLAGREALTESAPASMVSSADAAIASLDEARAALADDNAACQDGVAALGELQRVATEMVGGLDSAVSERIITRDGSMLWAISPAPQGPIASVARAGLVARWQHLVAYVQRTALGVSAHAIVSLLIAWLLLRMRRSLALPKEGGSVTLRAVVRRPVATAVILSLAASLPLYVHSPSAYLDILVAVAAIPLARTLRVLLPSVSIGPLVLAVGIYVAIRAVAIVGAAELPYRVGMSVVTVTAIGATLWASWTLMRCPPEPGRPPLLALRGTLYGAMALFGVALIGNVIGFVSLSTVLIEGVVHSVYVVIVVWAAVALLDGCVRLAVQLPVAQNLGMVRSHAEQVIDRTALWTRRLGLVGAGAYLMFLFSLLEPALHRADLTLRAELTVGAITVSLGDVLVFILAIWLAVFASRSVRFVLDEDVLPRMNLPKGIPSTVSTLTHYAILIVGGLVALGAAGLRLDQFAFAAGALGIGIGFGLQAIANNLVSGLILLFERPIQPGDIVEVGSLTGTVQRIGMRASRVRTLDGAEVIVPNSKLISDEVVNWTLSDRERRFEVHIGVEYGTRPEKVLALLQEVAEKTPGVLTHPATVVYLESFGESSVDFLIMAWAPYETYLQVRSATRVGVEAALRDAGITIPFPQRDLHLRSMPGPGASAKPPAEEGSVDGGGEGAP